MEELPISALKVNEEFVLAKCENFVDFQIWPINSVLSPAQWLSNFLEGEKIFATHLLNAFAFFSEAIVDELFAAAFQNLSAVVRLPAQSSRKAAWQHFADSVVITYVTGETPNATDSGFVFARKSRQVLEIAEDRIVSPQEALGILVGNSGRPVVFVDDFVGSGQQFIATWNRRYDVPNSTPQSFAQFANGRRPNIYYCPVFCTEYGMATLKEFCSTVTVSPANILSTRYSALHPTSLVWPDALREGAVRFLHEASKRAGYLGNDGGTDDWRGFHQLGLTIALHHSVPDATLPIFYSRRNGWKPLIRRR